MSDVYNLHDDDGLLAAVRDSLRGEAVIDMAFALRNLDAALADQIEDTALGLASAGVRSGVDDDRTITFRHQDLTIEVTIDATSGDVYGQLLPPRSEQVEIETVSSREHLPVDDLGRFVVRTDATQMRLRIASATGLVLSPWIFR